MKVKVRNSRKLNGYQSKSVTFTFDTREEEVGFAHLIGCNFNPENCNHKVQRDSVARRIHNTDVLDKLHVG
jgi:hypothetical protein